MASIAIDRTDGLSSATAIKGPVRVATTANIALTGLQTIDGVSLASGDRVLVKDQTTASENGIYVVDTGPWRRAKDFSGNRDVKMGTQILVTSGTLYASSGWYVSTADPIVIGTTAIQFTQNILLNAAQLIALEAAAQASANAAATSETNAGQSETDAQAAQQGAESARDAAAGYAAGLNLPPILAGDADKLLYVKLDTSGYELRPAQSSNTFATKAAAEAHAPAVAPDFIRTAGYSAAGDGGGVLYKKVAVEPTHAGKFSITLADTVTVVWYEIVPGLVARGAQFGITPATTSATSINDALSAAASAGAVEWHFEPGNYLLDGQITCPTTIDVVDGKGSALTMTGAGSRFFEYNAGLIALPAMTGNLGPGDDTITFASAHGLAKDEVFLIWNATDYSLNGWRNVYKDGQACVVHEVVSSTVVKIAGVLDPRGHQRSYPAAECQLFKYGKQNGFTLRNISFEGESFPITVARVYGVVRPRLEKVKTNGGVSHGMQVNKCAFGHDEDCDFGHDGAAIGNNYGMVGTNSGPWTSVNSRFYGTRHSCSLGGDSDAGHIPCRNWTFINPQFDSKEWLSLDLGHGNSLDCTVISGRASNGISLGGAGHDLHFKTAYASAQIDDNNFLLCAEMHGANHKVRIDRAVVTGTGLQSDLSNEVDGMIGLGGGGNGLMGLVSGESLTVHGTQEGGVLDIDVGQIIAPNWDNASAQVMVVKNRGFTGQWSVRQRIGYIEMLSESSILRYDTISGVEARRITIESIPDRYDSVGTDGWTTLPWAFIDTPTEVVLPPLSGSKVYDFGSLADGAQEKTTVAVAGASVGDFCQASLSTGLLNMTMTAFVESAGTVAVVLQNESGAVRDLGSATLRVEVQKPRA